MNALYAFLRRTDDLGDEPRSLDERRRLLEAWRASFERALEGRFDDPVLPAVAETLARYSIPPDYLREAIAGVEMDLVPARYERFDDLSVYCRRVASVVGLACIHVWGYRDGEAPRLAERCGLAFQLTNILRDLKEDAAGDRLYLPLDDLRRFDYSFDDLKAGIRDGRFRGLMRFEIARAQSLYDEGVELDRLLSADGRRIFNAMIETYHGLLAEISRRDGDVFGERIRLCLRRKLQIAARSVFRGARPPALRPRLGVQTP